MNLDRSPNHDAVKTWQHLNLTPVIAQQTFIA